MISNKLTFSYGICSEIGQVRESNQDSAFASKNFLLVADGMGGHAGGDVASTITVTMLSGLDNEAAPRGIARSRMRNTEAKVQIERGIIQVYLAILEAVKENPDLAGMGTTVTSVLRTEDSFVIAHLGDTRAYVLQNDELTQLTTDHTFVQHLVSTGKITETEAKNHPQKNVVMRVLGDFETDLNPDFIYRPIKKDDRYFLCSDGVCGVLTDDQIAAVLREEADPNVAAEKLVALALENGSNDNCTAIVADVKPEKSSSNKIYAPEFAGAAKESLQDYLNEIVEKSKKAAIEKEIEADSQNNENIVLTPSVNRRSLFNFFKRRIKADDDS